MDYFDGIYGNDRLKADLLASIDLGVLPHAHIFEGPPGQRALYDGQGRLHGFGKRAATG